MPRTARSLALLLALVLLVFAPANARAAGVRYAKPTATGTGDCLSWTNACTLQTALEGASSGDEIWVMQGIHTPTTADTDPRNATFQLKNGVALYGGFAGTEEALGERNISANVTTLSGEIGAAGNSDNAYHVVSALGTDSTAVLDGFIVTGGNANGGTFPYGGGLFSSGGSSTVRNVTFSSNSTSNYGGGMSNSTGSPTLTNVTFISNTATQHGGGLYTGGGGNPTLTNVSFSGNSANDGGGMRNWGSNPTLTNVTFSGNTASSQGGGMYHNTGIVTIKNAIFWDNTAGDGSQIFNSAGTLTIGDSIVEGVCPPSSTCTNVLTADPHLGTLGNYGGGTPTFPLLPGSSAIDAGNDTTCALKDQRDITRPQGAHCDIGAFESRGFALTKAGGDGQSTLVNTSFALPLQATFSEVGGGPFAGVTITYTAPSAGASAHWGASTAIAVTTDSTGKAVTTALTANAIPGSYAVTAEAPGVDSPVIFSLTNKVGTTTVLTSSVNPSFVGQNVTFTATVSGALPTGSVTFKDGTANILGCLNVPLAGGSAPCSTASLSPGTHSITAEYGGNATNNASSGSLTQQVQLYKSLLPLVLRDQ